MYTLFLIANQWVDCRSNLDQRPDNHLQDRMNTPEVADKGDKTHISDDSEVNNDLQTTESGVSSFKSAVDNTVDDTNVTEGDGKLTEDDDLNDYVPSSNAVEEETVLDPSIEVMKSGEEDKAPPNDSKGEPEMNEANDSIANADTTIVENTKDELNVGGEEPMQDMEHTQTPRDESNDLKLAAINTNEIESIDSEQGSVLINPQTKSEDAAEHVADTATESKTPKWFSFDEKADEFPETIELLASPPNMNLAYSRFQDNENELELKSSNDKKDVFDSRDNLKKTFNEIKTGVTITQNEELLSTIDWEFWSEVFNDYSAIVKSRQDELKRNITVGIPKEIRGMAWQIISDSNSMKLKEFFINNKDIKSDFSKLIKRDLVRTSFIKNSDIKEKMDDLFNIIKTYSIYDKEVGYTQGMAFITVPLLMNMESDKAFCMLVRLMFTYGFRELYLPEMPGLHLRIYQFDRLLEDNLPELYSHLKNQKISSSMYAIQWFLTLFAYKFPLDMVLRIYDVVIAEGVESILKFALNLMVKNNEQLLLLEFDELLNFLKEKLFYYYSEIPEIPAGDESGDNQKARTVYQIDRFIKDSMEVNILPITLNKYRAEFDEIDKLESERKRQVTELQSKNGLLTREIRKIEASYAILNKEHVEIADEMIQGKMKVGALEEENELLKEQINDLQERLNNLKNDNSATTIDFTASNSKLSNGLDREIQKAMEFNLQVMDQNRILEDQLAELETENRFLQDNKTKPLASMFKLKKGGKFW